MDTLGVSSLELDPLGIAAFLNPATDTKADGQADGEDDGDGGNEGGEEDGDDEGDGDGDDEVEGGEDGDTVDTPADKHGELLDNDPFRLVLARGGYVLVVGASSWRLRFGGWC